MGLLRIILLCIAAAVDYGVVHDQITIRVCEEYFTRVHPPVPFSRPPLVIPTVVALIWGVIATWWVGLLLGVPLALVSRVGSSPKISAGDLVRPLIMLLGVMALSAAASGVAAYAMTRWGALTVPRAYSGMIPAERSARFMAAAAAHLASYAVGFIGGLTLTLTTPRRRRRRAVCPERNPAKIA